MFAIQLKVGPAQGRKMALGNGTREHGERLATVSGDYQPDELLEMVQDVNIHEFETLPCTIKFEEGVIAIEVFTLLRNPHLCEFVTVSDEPASDTIAPTAPTEQRAERKKSTKRKR